MNEQKIIDERRHLEERIKSIDAQIGQLPSKHIYCSKNGNSFKWYESDGKKSKYIPKKQRRYAEQLAAKKYLMYLREDLLQEIRAIDFYLRHHNSIGERAERLLHEPAYKELLASYFAPISKELHEWMNASYERNELYPEKLIHKTNSGIYVRSKSESYIAKILHMKRIPFRYENLLELGENLYYPDFTIRHPRTGEIYYWEHFGMMDMPDYVRKACNKIQTYSNYGIIPGVSLITTFESKEHPLELEMIERIVEFYFEE